MDIHNVLLRPIITEKTLRLMAEQKYTFRVAREATKPEIARAVEEMFHVAVADVHTMNYRGKPRRGSKGRPGRTSRWKKAIVTLKAGSSIKLFEGV